MDIKTQKRVLREIANRCGLITKYNLAFLSSNNELISNNLNTSANFTRTMYYLSWAVWVFIRYSTICVRSKCRFQKEISYDYSISQLNVAIEDINNFVKEIKLHTVKERIQDLEKDFV